jgi:hypothetical protein
MSETRTIERFGEMPATMRALPLDQRGYPVPWFVAWIDGKPDFRVIRPGGVAQAVKDGRCWLCGRALGRLKAFVIGPMCAVNRVSSEPPSHPRCAAFAVRSCPFLTSPLARRNEREPMPDGAQDPAGVMIARNPGVTVIWSTLRFSVFDAPSGNPGKLIDIGKPHRVSWWAHGRRATRGEALEGLRSGLPALYDLAEAAGRGAVHDLRMQISAALALLPDDGEADAEGCDE